MRVLSPTWHLSGGHFDVVAILSDRNTGLDQGFAKITKRRCELLLPCRPELVGTRSLSSRCPWGNLGGECRLETLYLPCLAIEHRSQLIEIGEIGSKHACHVRFLSVGGPSSDLTF